MEKYNLKALNKNELNIVKDAIIEENGNDLEFWITSIIIHDLNQAAKHTNDFKVKQFIAYHYTLTNHADFATELDMNVKHLKNFKNLNDEEIYRLFIYEISAGVAKMLLKKITKKQ